MSLTGFQFMQSHIDRIDGVLVKVTITTVVEAIPDPNKPGHPVPGYPLPGGGTED